MGGEYGGDTGRPYTHAYNGVRPSALAVHKCVRLMSGAGGVESLHATKWREGVHRC